MLDNLERPLGEAKMVHQAVMHAGVRAVVAGVPQALDGEQNVRSIGVELGEI